MLLSFFLGMVVGYVLPLMLSRVKVAWAKPRRQYATPLLLDEDGWGTTVSRASSSSDHRPSSPAYDPFYTPTPQEIAQWRAAEGLPHDAQALITSFDGPTEDLFAISLSAANFTPQDNAPNAADRLHYFRYQYIARLTNNELETLSGEPPEIVYDGVDVRNLPNFQEVMRRS